MVATRTLTDLNFNEWYSIGAEPVILNLDMISAVNAKLSMGSTMDAVRRTVEQYVNIIGTGPLINSNTEQTIMVEQAGMAGATGLGKSTARTTLQAALRALGTVDSVNLSTATARDTSLTILIGALTAPATDNKLAGNFGINTDVA